MAFVKIEIGLTDTDVINGRISVRCMLDEMNYFPAKVYSDGRVVDFYTGIDLGEPFKSDLYACSNLELMGCTDGPDLNGMTFEQFIKELKH